MGTPCHDVGLGTEWRPGLAHRRPMSRVASVNLAQVPGGGLEMAHAAEARTWSPGALRGMIDSLYTPFSGPGGEEIDEQALRALVAHCLGALDHDGIWVGGLVGEYWALSTAERKRPPGGGGRGDTRHQARRTHRGLSGQHEHPRRRSNWLGMRQLRGPDICFLIPPYFEARGYESTREVLRYVCGPDGHRPRALQHPRRRVDPDAGGVRPSGRRVSRHLRRQERYVPPEPQRRHCTASLPNW